MHCCAPYVLPVTLPGAFFSTRSKHSGFPGKPSDARQIFFQLEKNLPDGCVKRIDGYASPAAGERRQNRSSAVARPAPRTERLAQAGSSEFRTSHVATDATCDPNSIMRTPAACVSGS
jgi:hypothetical protein